MTKKKKSDVRKDICKRYSRGNRSLSPWFESAGVLIYYPCADGLTLPF